MAGTGQVRGSGSNQSSTSSPVSTVPDLTLHWPPFYGAKAPFIPDTAPAAAPTFVVDWTTSANFPSQLVVSRTSSATYYDAFNRRINGASNVPRLEYDPANGLPQGLLGEEQRTNKVTQSDAHTNAAWTKSTLTAAASTTPSADGVTNMTLLTASAASTQPFLLSAAMPSYTGGQVFDVAFDVKPGTNNYFGVWVNQDNTGFWAVAIFDLSSGTCTQTSTGTTGSLNTITSTYVKRLANGIFRCGFIGSVGAAGNVYLNCGLAAAATGNTFPDGFGTVTRASGTFAGTETVLVSSSDFQLGSSTGSHIPTTTAAVTRSADIFSSTDAGLLAAKAWIIETSDMVPATAATLLGVNTVTALGATSGNALTTADGGTQTTTDTATWSGTNRAGIAWDAASRVSLVLNGGTVATAANTAATPTALYFGNTNNGASGFLNGHIRAIAAYSALTDTQLDTLSVAGSPFNLYAVGAVNFALDTGIFTETGNAAGISIGFPLGSGSFVEAGNAAGINVGFPLGSGSFTETGNAASISIGVPLGSGSFTETGNAAGFKVGFPLASGSFTETGNAATIVLARKIAAGSGAFTETGNPAGISIGFPLGAGSFAETGNAAGFSIGVPLGAGSFIETGNAAAFRINFPLGSGSFTETGNAAGISIGLPLGAGAFTETGNAAAFSIGFPLASGAFAEAGNAAGFRINFPLGSGTFIETGNAASINYSGAGDKVFDLGSGSFVETGNPASIVAARAFALGSGADAATGYGVSFGIGFPLSSGALAETGYPANFTLHAAGLTFALRTGIFVLTGYPASIVYNRVTGDPGLATRNFIWPKFPEGYSTLRVTTIKKAFSPANWETFLQLANIRCNDDYGYKNLVSQTFTDAVPAQNEQTGRLAIDFMVNDGRVFPIDLPDDMRGIYRGVLRQLIQ